MLSSHIAIHIRRLLDTLESGVKLTVTLVSSIHCRHSMLCYYRFAEPRLVPNYQEAIALRCDDFTMWCTTSGLEYTI